MNRLCEIQVRPETRTLQKKDWITIVGYPAIVTAALILSAFCPSCERQLLVVAALAGGRFVLLDLNLNETRIIIIEKERSQS